MDTHHHRRLPSHDERGKSGEDYDVSLLDLDTAAEMRRLHHNSSDFLRLGSLDNVEQHYGKYAAECTYKSWVHDSGDKLTGKEFNILWEWFKDSMMISKKEDEVECQALIEKCFTQEIFHDYGDTVNFFTKMDTHKHGSISFSELTKQMSNSSSDHILKLRQHIHKFKNMKRERERIKRESTNDDAPRDSKEKESITSSSLSVPSSLNPPSLATTTTHFPSPCADTSVGGGSRSVSKGGRRTHLLVRNCRSLDSSAACDSHSSLSSTSSASSSSHAYSRHSSSTNTTTRGVGTSLPLSLPTIISPLYDIPSADSFYIIANLKNTSSSHNRAQNIANAREEVLRETAGTDNSNAFLPSMSPAAKKTSDSSPLKAMRGGGSSVVNASGQSRATSVDKKHNTTARKDHHHHQLARLSSCDGSHSKKTTSCEKSFDSAPIDTSDRHISVLGKLRKSYDRQLSKMASFSSDEKQRKQEMSVSDTSSQLGDL